MGVRPRALGARRRAARVGGRHLPEQHERRRGQCPRLRSADHRTSPSSSAPRCTVPAPALAGAPRDRAVERPVDLDDRRVPLEVGEVAPQAGGARRRQAAARRYSARRIDVGDHRPARPYGQPGRGAHGDGATARTSIRSRAVRSKQRRPPSGHAAPARPPARPRPPPARGTRLLAEHRQHPTQDAADRCVRPARRRASRCPQQQSCPLAARTVPRPSAAPAAGGIGPAATPRRSPSPAAVASGHGRAGTG